MESTTYSLVIPFFISTDGKIGMMTLSFATERRDTRLNLFCNRCSDEEKLNRIEMQVNGQLHIKQ